jgi:single-stranded DNA-binding protein
LKYGFLISGCYEGVDDMSIFFSAYGFVDHEAESIGTPSGQSIASGSIVCHGCRDDGKRQNRWFTILGFGKIAEAMRDLRKGDPITVTGKLQVKSRRTKTGEDRNEMEIVVDQMLSARLIEPTEGE